MQDRYTGDIGDFIKYGLLRAICGRKRLGVAWYLYPDDGPDGDGKHIGYLRQDARWRPLDPRLFDVLKRLVDRKDRSVAAVQREGVLDGATFAGERLEFAHVPVRERGRWRREWFERVKARLSNCDLVFADPDNGLCPDDRFRPTDKKSAKRLPLAEAIALAQGRTAVLYHHNTRHPGGHVEEIQSLMGQLPGCHYAYYWRRWSNRTFFIVNADGETEHRLKSFEQQWGDHGRLVWRAPAAPSADPVIEAYKRDVDRTLLRQNLRRSVAERVANLMALQELAEEARRAGQAGGRHH